MSIDYSALLYDPVYAELGVEATLTVEGTTPTTALDLPLVPWEGGPAYWEQFAKADAVGWSNPSFFPIAVFLVKPDIGIGQPAALAALGCNVAMALEHTLPISDITDHMFVLANPDNPYRTPAEVGWDAGEVGSDPKVVGWFLCDEPDIGLGGFIGTDDEFGWLAALQALATTSRALNDGRFVFANFSNGVFNTFWSVNTFTDMVATVDACSIDVYAYTRPLFEGVFAASSEWTALGGTGPNSITSAAYGWLARRLGEYQSTPQRPYWVFVETKMPFLNEVGARVILYAQIEGAVWSAIAHEARGISYFQQNGFYLDGPVNDPNTGSAHCTDGFSLTNCEVGLQTAVAMINSQIAALAPVINTQSYVWDFGATGIDTMLKAKDGFAYIFASVGIAASTGSKTFTLPTGLITDGIAEALNESRTVNISGGQFSDTFANEYSHHTYKVALVDAPIGEVVITVIDETRRKTMTSGGVELRSVDPSACARIPELTELGIDRADYQGSVLSFNGRTWVVRSYDLLGSPNGEDLGLVRFKLSSVEST